MANPIKGSYRVPTLVATRESAANFTRYNSQMDVHAPVQTGAGPNYRAPGQGSQAPTGARKV